MCNLWLIHVAWQKPTQYCKAIILHLNFFFNGDNLEIVLLMKSQWKTDTQFSSEKGQHCTSFSA